MNWCQYVLIRFRAESHHVYDHLTCVVFHFQDHWNYFCLPLTHLDLHEIPRSGYIPPEAMATSLSALTSLESLCL